MIKNTIDLLSMGEYYGETKRIDIAKGFYEIPTNWKSAKQLIKRILWQRKSK
uniref:Uncharacterized protein n=1 Tax=uncultured Caudovirales phage TaxID=2100421 RepID=A0A6J7WYU4_9CAUD|nr:hypothetical protein UFOVP385_5 [uncultured Caudovirales phage]